MLFQKQNNRLFVKEGSFSSLKDGLYKLEPYYSNRTGEQNKYYWGVIIPLFSELSGYETDESHEVLKAMFLSEKKIVLGQEITLVKQSKKLTTKEFNEYIERISRFLATNGIVVPEPITGV